MPDLRSLAIRWFEEVWNERRDATIDELLAEDAVVEVEGVDGTISREGFKAYRRAHLSAVPDTHAIVVSAAAEGNVVVVHWRSRGTHTGAGLGLPPSGRKVDFSGLTMFEFKDGVIVRGFDRWNRGEVIASLMQVRLDEVQASTGLTPREAQVALLMAERFSQREIAAQLGISLSTARRHSEHVLMRLGISRRTEVASAIGRIPGSALARYGADL